MDNKLMSRLRPFFIYDILINETDEKHPLSTNDIIKRLEEKGAECERRALQADIKALQECGYPIKRIVSKDYKYFIQSRKFTDAEITTLMDAVQSVTFLTEDATWKIIEKLTILGGGGQEKKDKMLDSILFNSVHKTENDEVLHSAQIIENALTHNNKISFHYFHLNYKFEPEFKTEGENKKLYTVSPVAKTINNGNYYLLAITEGHEENLSIYPIDRMTDATILNQHIEVKPDPQEIEKFKKQLFEMYRGTPLTVKVKVHKNLLSKIYDTFGSEQISLTPLQGNPDYFIFTCEVMNSDMFKAWCCSYGRKIEILSPQSFIDELAAYTKELFDMYHNT